MKSRRIAWAVVVTLAVSVACGAWLLAQPKIATGTFGPIAANPAYIVVNTATPVVFTVQITDPQLKKRSVVLVRLDDAGQPSDIVGRLRDDGKNGDAVADDKKFSLKISLNEPVVGIVNFKIAARFKPGKWQEPEADDDDWDSDLTAVPTTGRDQPAERTKREKRLKKLARYSLSGPVVVTADPFLLPPDPGEAGRQTLPGIDSDNDGVRDDVQRWIGLTFRSSPRARAGYTQYAVAQQQFIVAAQEGRASPSNLQQIYDGLDCLSYLQPTRTANDILLELDLLTYDTPQRLQAMKIQWALVDGVDQSVTISELGRKCQPAVMLAQ